MSRYRSLLPLLLLAFISCGGGSDGTGPVDTDTTYSITLRWSGAAPSTTVQAAFAAAIARIEGIVTADIQDARVGTNATPFEVKLCNASFDGSTVNETVDDVVIYARVEAIDGVGNVLGSAGPCLTRNVGGLTALGVMRFDSADLQNLANNGRLGDVILHEMLHVVGVGTLWESKSLLAGKDSSTARVTGPLAASSCANELGGAGVCPGYVPAENCENLPGGTPCGLGTQNSHWKESTFATELMTGYAGATNPLSRMTIQGLADLGYTVNLSAANAYTVPSAPVPVMLRAEGDTGSAPAMVRLSPPMLPRFTVEASGFVRPIGY